MRNSGNCGALTRAVLILFLVAAGCGDDDDDGVPIAGAAGTFGGASGVGPASGTGGGGGASGTAGGGAGMTSMDAGGVVTCGSATCAAGERCVQGSCRRPCTGDAQCAGNSCCGGYCVDTDADREHCGGCNQACAAGLLCSAGECVQPMCAGEPGAPVDDLDAGSDDDGGASEDPPVFGDNGCPANESCVADGNDAVCNCGSGAGCPPDQTCSADGTCMCGDGEGCASEESCCGDDCVDLQTDATNCGRCGKTCRDGHVCRDGDCACPDAGETLCGSTCYDTDSDEDHCGNCRTRCADGATCEDGECTCDTAGEAACDGECIALDTNSDCGECGESCESPSICRDPDGTRPIGCYCPNVNDVPCNGACVSLGTTANCGACGDACTGAANVCRNRSCQCPMAGQTACGGSCVDLDSGVDSDPGAGTTLTHCGACGVTCMPGAACVNGECACPSASTTDMYCDEHPTTGATDGVYACIEVTTTKNCGDCGNSCLDDSECRETGGGDAPGDFNCACIGDDAGKTHCRGIGCRTLGTDEENCGGCGNVCPDNVTCTGGVCNCPGADSVIACLDGGEPKCVDSDTDPDHCGSCGNVCAGDEECCNGECVDPDADYDEDRLNCGQCGRRCANSGCGFLDLLECNCNNGACET